MQFNSIQFLIFLPLVVLIYYLIPQRFRWILLLLASYYFYMCWKAEYIFLILTSTVLDYGCGLKMGHLESLVVNLGLLFTFKYANFALETINRAFYKFDMTQRVEYLNVLLPVGISFYTFQTLSYSIEVFYGKIKPEKHLGYFALYVAFFPQLVAGPIERFDRLGPQFRIRQMFSYDNISNGLRLILYGLFIKMVIADNLAIYADRVYEDPGSLNSADILTGLLFYSFQIYSDFYGYSLIAIGSARLLGIRIMDNFRTPYLSRSIGEFWQRWHISLSTWFRDYLYLPLGGNRVKRTRWVFNIIVVFTISGFWHGANWTFIIWGFIFGLVYLVENILPFTGKIRAKDPFKPKHLALVPITFLITTTAWIFFRSENLEKVVLIFKSLFRNIHQTDPLQVSGFVWIFLFFFLVLDLLLYNTRFDTWLANRNFIIRWAIYIGLIVAIIFYAGMKDIPFIYFQF
jgi:alginate O-acetyltransferase complex protein AlgI